MKMTERKVGGRGRGTNVDEDYEKNKKKRHMKENEVS